MRGFLVGLIVIPLVVLTLLSLRPGGLRQQLRNMVRRLKVALALAAVYLIGSGILRVGFGDSSVTEYGIPILALLLAVVFVVVGQDPKPDQLERR